MDDDIEALRTELSRLAGAARTYPLCRLGQLLMDRYWRAGPGKPDALPYLDDAIEAMDEAYGHLDPTDRMRGTLAGQLGWLVGTRYTVHGGPERDRETGILLIEEAFTFPDLPSTARIFRLVLGQLYLMRQVTQMFHGGQLPAMLGSGSTSGSTTDVDRAADCFRQFLAGPPMGAEMTTLAQTMLATVEAMQTMLGGSGPGVAGFDLGKLAAATTMLQNMQQRVGSAAAGGNGMPAMPWLLDPAKLASLDPLDRPVTVVQGTEPQAAARPPSARPAAVRTDLDAVRRLLREQLALAGGSEDPYLAIEAILRPEAPPLAVHVVDELVGLAATVVDHDAADGIDALLLAAALYLRSRHAGAGRRPDDDLASDAGAAAQQLLAAAETLPTEEPRAVAVVLRLAALLGAEAIPDRLARRYADVARAAGALGAGGLVLPQPDGLLLLDATTGRLASVHPGELPDRLLAAGDGPVEAGDAVVSYVASGAQVTALARRGRLALTADPVFVANPRGDLAAASIAAMVLRRTFYPRSTGLGRTIEYVDGAGSPDEVLAHLDASLLHLDCAVTAGGALQLAGAGELSPGQVAAASGTDRAAGGLAILPRSCHGFVALADALIAAGFTGVIGWLRPVPEPVVAPALFVLHAKLVDEGRAPAQAVHEVRRWMRDRGRTPLPDLPAGYAAPLDGIDLADPAHWTALVHRGG